MASHIEEVARLAQSMGFLFDGNGRVDPFLPFFDQIALDRGVVVVKQDGRRGPDDGGQYTVIISGGALGDDYVRADGNVLEDAIASAVLQYARRGWQWK